MPRKSGPACAAGLLWSGPISLRILYGAATNLRLCTAPEFMPCEFPKSSTDGLINAIVNIGVHDHLIGDIMHFPIHGSGNSGLGAASTTQLDARLRLHSPLWCLTLAAYRQGHDDPQPCVRFFFFWGTLRKGYKATLRHLLGSPLLGRSSA